MGHCGFTPRLGGNEDPQFLSMIFYHLYILNMRPSQLQILTVSKQAIKYGMKRRVVMEHLYRMLGSETYKMDELPVLRLTFFINKNIIPNHIMTSHATSQIL